MATSSHCGRRRPVPPHAAALLVGVLLAGAALTLTGGGPGCATTRGEERYWYVFASDTSGDYIVPAHEYRAFPVSVTDRMREVPASDRPQAFCQCLCLNTGNERTTSLYFMDADNYGLFQLGGAFVPKGADENEQDAIFSAYDLENGEYYAVIDNRTGNEAKRVKYGFSIIYWRFK
jgi:hypothetical protein